MEKKTQRLSFYCILLNARAGKGEGGEEEELGIELDRLGLGIELGLGTELGLGMG